MATQGTFRDEKYNIIHRVKNSSNISIPEEYNKDLDKFAKLFNSKLSCFLFLASYGVKHNCYFGKSFKDYKTTNIYRAGTAGAEVTDGLGSFFVCVAFHHLYNIDKSIKEFDEIFEKSAADIIHISEQYALGALDYIFTELGWTDGRNMPKEIFDEINSI